MTLVQRWSDHVMPTPTFNQQTDTLPTLDQCTDADWVLNAGVLAIGFIDFHESTDSEAEPKTKGHVTPQDRNIGHF